MSAKPGRGHGFGPDGVMTVDDMRAILDGLSRDGYGRAPVAVFACGGYWAPACVVPGEPDPDANHTGDFDMTGGAPFVSIVTAAE